MDITRRTGGGGWGGGKEDEKMEITVFISYLFPKKVLILLCDALKHKCCCAVLQSNHNPITGHVARVVKLLLSTWSAVRGGGEQVSHLGVGEPLHPLDVQGPQQGAAGGAQGRRRRPRAPRQQQHPQTSQHPETGCKNSFRRTRSSDPTFHGFNDPSSTATSTHPTGSRWPRPGKELRHASIVSISSKCCSTI